MSYSDGLFVLRKNVCLKRYGSKIITAFNIYIKVTIILFKTTNLF